MSQLSESCSDDAHQHVGIMPQLDANPIDANSDSSEKESSSPSDTDEAIESDYIFEYSYEKEDEIYEAICKYDDGPRDDYYDDRYD
jgi:hypothetical protein